jgi:predicted nucleotidyltransferase
MKEIGIADSDIQNIIEIIRKNNRIEKVILFGSRAKGSYHNGSDIDLALSGFELCTNDIIDLAINMEELNLPYKFDFVIIERIKEQALLEHIQRIGITLYEKKTDKT